MQLRGIPSSIRVIAFDFDNTLVDESFSVRKRWTETLKQFSHLSKEMEKIFWAVFAERGSEYGAHVNETLKRLGLPAIVFLKDFLTLDWCQASPCMDCHMLFTLSEKCKQRYGILQFKIR